LRFDKDGLLHFLVKNICSDFLSHLANGNKNTNKRSNRMSKLIKPVMSFMITVGLLLMSLGVVQARLFRGGRDTYYDILNVCQDGMEFDIAIDRDSQPTIDITGTLLLTGATVAMDTVALDNVPQEIPDLGWVDWSKNITLNWNTTLLPGSRIRLKILLPGDGATIFTSVQDCNLTDLPAVVESTIIPDPIGFEWVPPDFLPFPNTIPGCISSTMQVDLNQPVGDLNLAMWTDLWNTIAEQAPITATLTSPAGTTITLINGESGGYSGFGTRCRDLRNNLLYDPLADFILDDDSAFQFMDLTPPYTDTAVVPFEALNTFRGENAAGTWTLDMCTYAPPIPGGGLECWYLQFEEAGTVSGHLYIDTNGNRAQDLGEPDLAYVDMIITDSKKQVRIVTSDTSGDWSAVVPPGTTTTAVDSSDPDFPDGYMQTEGTNPTNVTAVTGDDVFAGNNGFFEPIEIFIPLLGG
jgi:hypothetical protein